MLVDTHCHLDQFDDPAAVLREAGAHGVSRVVAMSQDIASMEAVLRLRRSHPDAVVAALGLHPATVVEQSAEQTEGALAYLADHLADADVLGEVGLDYKWADTEERKLLQSVVDFGGTLVREVMTPRPDIVAIAHDATVAEFRALFAEEEYSRIPVYKGNLDNVLGFVFAKDLVTLDGAQGTSRIVPQLLRPAHVVPEGKRVAELLRELQVKQVQSAIVVDEYGGVSGLVTIEDLLEEIVGEIQDEFDVGESEVQRVNNDEFLMDARANVDQLTDLFGVSIEGDGFDTLGGFVYQRLGKIPSPGDVVDYDGLRIEVVSTTGRRLKSLRVTRKRGP